MGVLHACALNGITSYFLLLSTCSENRASMKDPI